MTALFYPQLHPRIFKKVSVVPFVISSRWELAGQMVAGDFWGARQKRQEGSDILKEQRAAD